MDTKDDTSSGLQLPPIAAIYLVVFDQKVGYTVAWKRCLDDLSLDGVEFKALPSGLHNIRTDLIYFLHGAYVGASVFLQEVADAQARNAAFVSVGILVPQSYGRLGKSWLHAEKLRQLAKLVVSTPTNTGPLEDFWKSYRLGKNGPEGAPSSQAEHRKSWPPRAKTRGRAESDATILVSTEPTLTEDHPALSTSLLLDTFGPLIFPLLRAALLRKRILLVGSAPVQQICNYVYDLSILSNIPLKLVEILDVDTETLFRMRPLFNVGIHDIPFLEKPKPPVDAIEAVPQGWMACTTDEVLAEKKRLYDIVVELKPLQLAPEGRQRWPRLRMNDGRIVRATQRDLRRFMSLSRELRRTCRDRRRAGIHFQDAYQDDDHEDDQDDQDDDHDDEEQDEQNPLLRSTTSLNEPDNEHDPLLNDSFIVEPQSWTTMAYTSFMWWASAGEKDAFSAEEAAADHVLMSDLPSIEEAMWRPESPVDHRTSSSRPSSSRERDSRDELHRLQHTATVIVAYSHRLTTLILETIAAIVEQADDETEEGIEEDALDISSEDMKRMGLDADSEGDRDFVKEMVELYFRRQAIVVEGGVIMCGLRVC